MTWHKPPPARGAAARGRIQEPHEHMLLTSVRTLLRPCYGYAVCMGGMVYYAATI